MALLITHDMYKTPIPMIPDKSLIHFPHCSYARVYKAYMNIWSPLLAKFLRCRKDVENEHDVHAVVIEKEDS